MTKDTISPAIPETASAVLIVSKDALIHNYKTLERSAYGATIAPVVKANAYGIGAYEVIRTLESKGAKHFFVATVEEALALRAKGVTSAIYTLNNLWKSAMEAAARARVIPVLSDLSSIEAWYSLARKTNCHLSFWAQIETGLNRLGLDQKSITKLAYNPFDDYLTLEGVMSHLACSYDATSPYNDVQRTLFKQYVQHFPRALKSLSNSGGMLLGANYCYDVVRAGRFLYGSSLGWTSIQPNIEPLRHVLTLKGRIVQVRSVPTGATVGYDQSYTTTRPSKIVTVSLGYGDGYFQSLSNKGVAWIDDHKLPVIGRVSMDLLTLDSTDVPDQVLENTTWVDLFNSKTTIDDVAAQAETNVWETLTHLGKRIYTIYH